MDLLSVSPQTRIQDNSNLSPLVPVVQNPRSSPVRMYNFSLKDIVGYLFNHSEVKSVKSDEKLAIASKTSLPGIDCAACSEHSSGKCSKHKHLETLRILKSPDTKDKSNVARALNSFPSEVELCTSSVPGKRYGVRALQTIPKGTWIGPYEGKHIRPEDLTPDMDTSYMWEIFQDGKLLFYLDASDETQSSWMRYICCARYKEEQNTSVMQYFGNIYYRVFKDIPPGEEILVWYDDSCPHYLGIPLKMQDIGTSSGRKSRVINSSEGLTLPSLSQALITTGNPPTTSISQRTIMSPMLQGQYLQYPQYQVPPVVRQRALLPGFPTNPPGFPTNLPSNHYDVILPSAIGYNSGNILRKHDDTYPKTSLYGKSTSHSGYKKESTNTIMTNCTNKPFISHRAKPYSRDIPSDQSKMTYSRDVAIDQTMKTSSSMKSMSDGHLTDQNGNIEYRPIEKVYYPGHKMIMATTDETINKFLSQLEEARNEQKNMEIKRQNKEQEQENNELNHCKQAEKDLESEISMWKCGQCEKSFAQQQILQLHICSCVPEKPYQCTYCTEAFAQPSELRTHAVIHSGKKPFKCGFCSRLFAGSTTLNNHIRTHTGERPFGCEKCGRAFSQASQLSRHRRTMFECT